MGRPTRRRVCFGVLLSCVLALVQTHDARANMAKWWTDGEAHGPLLPQSDTSIRVDSEDLAFVLEPRLLRAEVTATYHLTNGGPNASQIEVAFVMIAGELTDEGGAVARPSVQVDGAVVQGRTVTEIDVLLPKLEDWLVEHPAAEPELVRLAALDNRASPDDFATIARIAPGCKGECRALLDWHRTGRTRTVDVQRRELVLRAAREAIPKEVAALQNGWSTLRSDRPLSWVLFPLEIAAGGSRTVTVRYSHVASSNSHRAVNTVFTYEYLLSPARRWARFGDLHVSIQLPKDAKAQIFSSTLPFTADGDGDMYRANMSGLPQGELAFEVMSKKGLFLGLTQPLGYWLILLAAMLLATTGLAQPLGRYCARASTGSGVWLGCIFGGFIGGLLWNGAIAFALSSVFPQQGFGHGYEAAFGLLLVVPFFALIAVMVGVVTARRHRRVS